MWGAKLVNLTISAILEGRYEAWCRAQYRIPAAENCARNSLRSLLVVLCCLKHRMHAADQVRQPDIWPELSRCSSAAATSARVRSGYHAQGRNVIGDHDPIEVHVHQRLHDYAHVGVAIVDQG